MTRISEISLRELGERFRTQKIVFSAASDIYEQMKCTSKGSRECGDMLPWYTGKACEHTRRSHINLAIFDSRWEASEAFELDRVPNVAAWVKNDHLGFEITYFFRGIVRKFRPDYLVRLKNGKSLVLEVKG